jgi:hypothetical protein
VTDGTNLLVNSNAPVSWWLRQQAKESVRTAAGSFFSFLRRPGPAKSIGDWGCWLGRRHHLGGVGTNDPALNKEIFLLFSLFYQVEIRHRQLPQSQSRTPLTRAMEEDTMQIWQLRDYLFLKPSAESF